METRSRRPYNMESFKNPIEVQKSNVLHKINSLDEVIILDKVKFYRLRMKEKWIERF